MKLMPLTEPGDAIACAARAIIEMVQRKPDAILGLATGGTMEPLYALLVAAHRDGLSFARIRTVNLDEYVGLPPDHPNSYHRYMARHFLEHVDVPPANSFIPCGHIDPARAASQYASLLDDLGPVDLQLLGIGENGHIGFNEPGTALDAPTRVTALSPITMAANARFFSPGAEVPSQAVTMGTAAILSARRIVVLATGRAKSAALADALDGPVCPECPASYLRLHPDCTIHADHAAGALLRVLPSQRPAA
ncbi:glucosamine-6-phosphate deaminase [Paracoccus sp. MBLB3053]|uniref:Glucosamine-6-phosphate deaminase n=1 Tax=Paracoccus aurantius TaxID=3073814 RepID=A0ABU2HX48_9RHOB|nr:glucosamine-6-phosphate deaminase [Paracoccus sp. MBLB3053]MDS9469130.1 glucosamine-6-phosphate deaminase [Paracoccus sp. MBLB3053]